MSSVIHTNAANGKPLGRFLFTRRACTLFAALILLVSVGCGLPALHREPLDLPAPLEPEDPEGMPPTDALLTEPPPASRPGQ